MFIKHRRSAAGWIAAALLATPVIAGVVGARSVEAAPPTWTVSWSLNPSNDIEELSRTFDVDEDGVIDASADPSAALPQILNPDQFSLHVRACTAPPGFTSVDWTLARPGEAPLPVVTTAECETDLVLPDKPFPEAREYTLTAAVHYPSTPDQVSQSAVHVQDVFMVGFGDSYGSGEGNPLTIDEWFGSQEATWDNKRCHRSRLSGQEIAAQELDMLAGVNVTFLHLACSGALASEGILQPYMGIEPSDDNLPPLPPQIDQAAEYVDYTTNTAGEKRYPDVIVTSIGGNDAGFATVVEECVTYPDWILVPIPWFPFAVPVDFDPCFAPGHSGDKVFGDGLAVLPGLYTEINSAVDNNVCNPNPNLTCDFLITEYPDGATDEDGEPCSVNPGFSEEEFQWVIDSMVPRLNNQIAASAGENGWKYVNGVRDNFYKHGICAEDDYLRDLAESKDIQGGIDGAFHPDTKGHMFGYAPAIGSALRNVLGFPYSGPTYTGPMYAGTGAPQVCDSKVRDGNRESNTVAPATDPTGLNLPSDLAADLAGGRIPRGQASANSCSVLADSQPPSGQTPLELRSGSAGCPSDPRPCVGSNGAGALLRFPVWGDQAPMIEAQVAADADGKAGDDLPTQKHRTSSGGANGTTAFYAVATEGSDTVTGEVVVDLTAFSQSGGHDSSSLTTFDLELSNVTHQDENCEEEFCLPSKTTTIGEIELTLERDTCLSDTSFSCGTGEMHNGSRHDIVEMHASAGDQTIVEIDEHDSYPYGVGAAGSMVAVSSGITVPQRQVRLPYSVPAGSVVLVKVAANTYDSVGESCTWDDNSFPCSAQGRLTSRIGFAPNGGTGALVPLAGFVAPAAGDTTAPTVTATPTGTAGNAGWYRSNVAVALAATDEDGGSGVASINYAVDGGPAQMVDAAAANVTVTGSGTHNVTYTATDATGNTSPSGAATFKIDATAPVISITPVDGTTYAKGANVPTGLACSDPHSGVATCTGPATLDTSTSGSRTVTFNATDLAGNSIQRTLAYTVLAPPPPPPAKDVVNIRIPELGYTVDGAVTSGGFEITKSSNGQVTSVSGTATYTRTNGNRVTVTILVVRIAGVWIGAINVNDPSARVNVSAGTLSRSGVTAVGSNGATGQFTTGGRPNRTINWTVTDND